MKRKDCDISLIGYAVRRAGMPGRAAGLALGAAALLGAAGTAQAGQVRLWSSAVVASDSIRLADVSEIRGFDDDEESKLIQMDLTDAPVAGGTRVVHIEMLRVALAAAGINMAKVTFGGARQCEVSRPAKPAVEAESAVVSASDAPKGAKRAQAAAKAATSPAAEAGKSRTLRSAVEEHFSGELARYGGNAEVIFDRIDEQVLDLSGPAYEFTIRRRGGPPLGLCSVEVDVVSSGRTVQTVPLVTQVMLKRRVVVARRPINQGATIAAGDLDAISMSFTRLDQLGLDEVAAVVGQRAKRFIAAGSTLDASELEAVPLVLRGQLVTLRSTVGGVTIVTTAKAGADGLRGEAIKVRSADDKRVEFDAVVVGPGEVRVGPSGDEDSEPRLAWSDRP